ncbi:MAG: F0F1 ATP synthase subunit gamma [Paludibacteraceae bacterium]
MGSLKEIKSRIQSVKSTQKITSAMKMVSSAKLRRAQKNIENFYPYNQSVTKILNNFLSAETDINSIFAESREIKRIAIVVFSSNGSLNGAFNSNVAKKLNAVVEQNRHLGNENILIYPVGKKIFKATRKMGFTPQGDYEELADKPDYKSAQELANLIMQLYQTQSVDKVILIYHHFKSRSSQILVNDTLIPIVLNADIREEKVKLNYIVEPDKECIIHSLIPKVIRLRLFTALLDSVASEHAARVMAMQIATDNADDLLQELSLQYNKSRQQAITNELLDIIGGSFGQQQ